MKYYIIIQIKQCIVKYCSDSGGEYLVSSVSGRIKSSFHRSGMQDLIPDLNKKPRGWVEIFQIQGFCLFRFLSP